MILVMNNVQAAQQAVAAATAVGCKMCMRTRNAWVLRRLKRWQKSHL